MDWRQYLSQFEPKLLTVLRQGYGWSDLRADAVAGLTVAVVALPLAMALAIASGTSPEKGLHTAIIAGFLISALGGSRVQIGGPTAAFIPVVFVVIEKFGYGGLILCTLMPGLMLIGAGLPALIALAYGAAVSALRRRRGRKPAEGPAGAAAKPARAVSPRATGGIEP